MAKKKDVEIKTEEVNELLSAVPGSIVSWGITVIFFTILSLLSLTFFIRYPDKLVAKTTITTLDPPVTLLAKTSGKITALNTENNQLVKKGAVLMVIENTTDYRAALKVKKNVRRIAKGSFKNTTLNFSSMKEYGELGELTPAFLQFVKSYAEYKLFTELTPEIQEIKTIEIELFAYRTLQKKYRNQERIYNEEFKLVRKDFKRYKILFKNKTISAKEFEDKKREYLSSKRDFESMKIAKVNNNIIVNNLIKNKQRLQIQAHQKQEKYFRELNQSSRALLSQIEAWEQKYLIKSPVDGKVSLFSFWAVNQNIQQGDAVLSVIQYGKQNVIAKLIVPVANSGKLRIGQAVNIKLNNYHFQEYGMLKGVVKSVSLMPQNENYAIEVELPKRLKTSYNKQLEYREEMHGTADIITEDLSIFTRIFFQFRKLMNK